MSNLKGMRTPRVNTWQGPEGSSQDNYPAALAKLQHLADKVGGAGLRVFDDFSGTALNTALWTYAEGTDTATAGNTIVAAGAHALRLTTGDTGNGFAADAAHIAFAALQFSADKGLLFRTRVRLSAITDVGVSFGFTDNVALEQVFAIGASDAITSNASDAVAVTFQTAADTDKWLAVGVKGDTDTPLLKTEYAPVAATWEEWEIEITKLGHAYFYRNGKLMGELKNAITPGTPVTPFVQAWAAGAASRDVDFDYIEAIALDR